MRLLHGGGERALDQDWVLEVEIPGLGPIAPEFARALDTEGDVMFFIGLRSLLAAGVPRDGVHAIAIGIVARIGVAVLAALPPLIALEALAGARAQYEKLCALEAEDAARRAMVPELRIVR